MELSELGMRLTHLGVGLISGHGIVGEQREQLSQYNATMRYYAALMRLCLSMQIVSCSMADLIQLPTCVKGLAYGATNMVKVFLVSTLHETSELQ